VTYEVLRSTEEVPSERSSTFHVSVSRPHDRIVAIGAVDAPEGWEPTNLPKVITLEVTQ
jgi:hypothetical protein